MVIDLKALKKQGHEALQNNYWKTCFMTGLMLVLSYGTIFTAVLNFIEEGPAAIRDMYNNMLHLGRGVDMQVIAVAVTLAFGLLLLNTIFKIIVSIFVKNPAEIGIRLFMRKNLAGETPGMIADVARGFDYEYTNNVKCMLMVQIMEFVWGLLLIIPGIYKSYEYRLVPYILAENSMMTPLDAMNKSKQMMMGYKKSALILDISFIPWHILGMLTLGLLELFFVVPYKHLTEAAFYELVKANMNHSEN